MQVKDNKETVYGKIFNYISDINTFAYNDMFLLSNQVLSKNPFTNEYIRNYLNKKNIVPLKVISIIKKLFRYYIRSLLIYVKYLLEKLAFLLSQQRYKPNSNSDNLIVIDTFFLVEKILNDKNYKDDYDLEGIFENTNPLSSAGKVGESPSPSSPLGDVDPRDPGVDISMFTEKKKVWQQMIK